MRGSLADRLWAKVDASGPCWLWTGSTNHAGYGRISRGKRGEGTIVTHVAAFELLVGPVPAGLELDHLCLVKRCCNPDHLEPVTRSENIRRRVALGVWPARLTCLRGHQFDGINTHNGQRTCSTCSRERKRHESRV